MRVGTGAGPLGGAGVVALIGRMKVEHGTSPPPGQAIANIKQDIATVSERAHR